MTENRTGQSSANNSQILREHTNGAAINTSSDKLSGHTPVSETFPRHARGYGSEEFEDDDDSDDDDAERAHALALKQLNGDAASVSSGGGPVGSSSSSSGAPAGPSRSLARSASSANRHRSYNISGNLRIDVSNRSQPQILLKSPLELFHNMSAPHIATNTSTTLTGSPVAGAAQRAPSSTQPTKTRSLSPPANIKSLVPASPAAAASPSSSEDSEADTSSPFVSNPNIKVDEPEIRLQTFGLLSSPDSFGFKLNQKVAEFNESIREESMRYKSSGEEDDDEEDDDDNTSESNVVVLRSLSKNADTAQARTASAEALPAAAEDEAGPAPEQDYGAPAHDSSSLSSQELPKVKSEEPQADASVLHAESIARLDSPASLDEGNTTRSAGILDAHSSSGLLSPTFKSSSSPMATSPRFYNNTNASAGSHRDLSEGGTGTYHGKSTDFVSLENSIQNYDDTQVQLNRDLDDLDYDIKLSVPGNRASVASDLPKSKSTPWRRLRSSKIYSDLNFPFESPDQQQQQQQQQYLDTPSATAVSQLAKNDHISKILNGNNNLSSSALTSHTSNHTNNINANGPRKNDVYSSSHTSKIEELNKQIVSYRIQIKFFRDFLQNIIQKGDSPLVVGDIIQFQKQLPFSSSNSISEHRQIEELQAQLNHLTERLKKQDVEYNEIFKLNEDLYANLEGFQNDLIYKENLLKIGTDQITGWCRQMDEIMAELLKAGAKGNHSNSNSMSLREIQQHLSSTSINGTNSESLSTKVQLVFKHLVLNGSSLLSPPTTPADELQSYIDTIEQLVEAVQSLKAQVTFHTQNTAKVETHLNQEIQSSQQLKQNYAKVSKKLNLIMESINSGTLSDALSAGAGPVSPTRSRQLESLKTENIRLTLINKSVDNKLEEYQREIDHLQDEVNNLKAVGEISGSTNNLSHTEILTSQKEIKELHDELQALTESYRKLQHDSSKKITSLTNQLHNKKQEAISLKADKNVADRLKQELDIAIEKQRILQAEKIRLTYTVDTLTNDKATLQSSITSLTDQVTQYAASTSRRESESQNSEAVLAKLNIVEYQFEELFSYDIVKFQNLLDSFVKIADDISLKDPKKKIDWLIKHILRDSEEDVRKWDASSGSKRPYQYHKSVFDYFVRAVDIIVHDHVKLLLKEGEAVKKKEEYILKLQQRIDELNAVNDALTDVSEATTSQQELLQSKRHSKSVLQKSKAKVIRQGEEYRDDDHDGDSDGAGDEEVFGSPRTKLRIEELTNRWKAEREARVYENKASQKRLRELEIENAKLRNELSRLN